MIYMLVSKGVFRIGMHLHGEERTHIFFRAKFGIIPLKLVKWVIQSWTDGKSCDEMAGGVR